MVHVLLIFYIQRVLKLKKNNSGAKRLKDRQTDTETDGRTDRHDDVNSRYSRPHAKAPKTSNSGNRGADTNNMNSNNV